MAPPNLNLNIFYSEEKDWAWHKTWQSLVSIAAAGPCADGAGHNRTRGILLITISKLSFNPFFVAISLIDQVKSSYSR